MAGTIVSITPKKKSLLLKYYDEIAFMSAELDTLENDRYKSRVGVTLVFSPEDEEKALAEGNFLLWVEDEHAIGMLKYNINKEEGGNIFLGIASLYVMPHARGKGIAMKLIGESINVGKRNKADVVNISVGWNNESAIRLYEKVGFLRIYERMAMKL